MTLLKDKLSEAKNLYLLYWESYMNGELETFVSTLDEDFEMIGTSESEVAHSKAEGIAFFKAQLEEVVGKADMRNRQISAKPLGDMVLVNETCDIYVLGEPDLPADSPYLSVGKQDWTFYSKIRISTLLHETNTGWKVIQQHGSLPDMRVQEGETIAFEKITKENLELRDAIKRRTIELENKTKELEIEAALERVRTVAMGMDKPDDMLDVCRVISDQLQGLGISGLRNVQTAIFNPDHETYMNYEYFSGPNKTVITEVAYKEQIDVQEFATRMLSDPDAFFTVSFTSEQVNAFIAYQERVGQFIDPKQYEANKMHYYFFSIGPGALGVSTYLPCSDHQLIIIKRFRNVFELAYKRYADIELAAAQAREAQIELALERVRARTMAMHNSEELKEVIQVVYDQFLGLNIHVDHAGFILNYKEREDMHIWLADHHQGVPSEITMPYFDSPHWNSYVEAKATGQNFFTNLLPFEVKNKFYQDLFELIPELTEEARKAIFRKPALAISTVLLDNVGLYMEHYSETPFTAEENKILMRFGNVFQQTYTRFLDLQKAEAQAREAQIEASLERVRAHAMGLRKSEELENIISVIFEELQKLGLELYECSIFLRKGKTREFTVWAKGNSDDTLTHYQFLFVDHPLLNGVLHDLDQKIPYREFSMEEDELRSYGDVIFSQTDLKDAGPEYKEAFYALQKVYAGQAIFQHGFLEAVGTQPLPGDLPEVLKRFSQVIDLTYTRFLDLKKAEAQAREAQIQLALERVRARTMSMQKSDELSEVSNLLNKQVIELGIPTLGCAFNIFNEHDSTEWFSDLEGTLPPYQTPREYIFKKYYEAGQRGESLLIEEFSGDRIKELYRYFASLNNSENEAINNHLAKAPEYQINHIAYFKYGYLLFISLVPAPEAHDVFKRFAKEFEQTYTRFLDLKKAEAQAREAQIQLSLERIRAKAMAMQHSDELSDFLTVLFEQFTLLDLKPVFCHLSLLDLENNRMTYRMTGNNGARLFSSGQIGLDISSVWYDKIQELKLGQPREVDVMYFPNEIIPEISSHVKEMLGNPPENELPQLEDFPDGQYVVEGYCKYGYLGYSASSPPSEEEKLITGRIANEFGNVYQRFLDLQKAEAQAREVEIELALERVRARTMAMQHSDELAESSKLLEAQVRSLGIETWGCAFHIFANDPQGDYEWFSSPEGILPFYKTPREHFFLKFYELGQSGVKFHIEEFLGEACKTHFEYIMNVPVMGNAVRSMIASRGSMPESLYDHLAYFKNGFLLFITYQPVPEAHDIFKRFAMVFDQTYTRFLDLQKAEAQAREAIKQASLDRVRGVISGMRSAADLDLITPLIFKELTILGVPFIRCGVFIINEIQEIIEAYLSSPEGSSLGVLRLAFQASELTYQTVLAWRQGMVFRQHWNKEDFVRWIEELMRKDQIQDSSTYQGTAAPPESLELHFVPFAQGMLYVGAEKPLDEKELELVQALAKAFSIAYARYEDFVKLEQAKAEVESAMSELKATQSQLVQQEKLASLGQLTAGIAHEIKNPLNFVNNFSEVSIEMIEEALEELEKREARDETLIQENLEDIRSNLKKVHEHGSRANGIVTSMLQHSRGGTGKKEPTDLNALIKEYTNLAFHGMRAGKTPINVAIDLQLDAQIKEVPLIGEDFSRVLLNLCNNAFDAMRATADERPPKLTIRTKHQTEKILIAVEDNGPGIPDEIKDKILQPFFTTKKGTEGTGLGLSITHDIIKAHGGELKVETKVGEGTSFIIDLEKKQEHGF